MAGDKAFRRDVDQDAEREQRVLLNRSLDAKGHCRQQVVVSHRHDASVEHEQRLFARDEVADLGNEFDHAVRAASLAHQGLEIDSQHDF